MAAPTEVVAPAMEAGAVPVRPGSVSVLLLREEATAAVIISAEAEGW